MTPDERAAIGARHFDNESGICGCGFTIMTCEARILLAALAESEALDMGRLQLAVGILAGTGELGVNYKRDINKETMRIAAAIARECAALADTPEPTPQ